MDVRITKENKVTTLEELGIIIKDFKTSSISIEVTDEHMEGRHGTVDYGATYGTRTITVPFIFKSKNLLNYTIMRDKLFGLLVDVEPYYIEELRRAEELSYKFVDTNQSATQDYHSTRHYATGKRYLVRLSNQIDLEQMAEYGEGELQFTTIDLPFAESIRTSREIEELGFIGNNEAINLGLNNLPYELKYSHNTKQFYIYNMGNVNVDPYIQDINITIQNIKGSTDTIEILNKTNGDVFKIYERLDSTDVIELKRGSIYKNKQLFTRKTNRKLLSLESGKNEIVINGLNYADISFDFRYYYK